MYVCIKIMTLIDTDSEESDCTDFHEGKSFTPMKHRPMIKSTYYYLFVLL